jgi:hypothetical protein
MMTTTTTTDSRVTGTPRTGTGLLIRLRLLTGEVDDLTGSRSSSSTTRSRISTRRNRHLKKTVYKKRL